MGLRLLFGGEAADHEHQKAYGRGVGQAEAEADRGLCRSRGRPGSLGRGLGGVARDPAPQDRGREGQSGRHPLQDGAPLHPAGAGDRRRAYSSAIVDAESSRITLRWPSVGLAVSITYRDDCPVSPREALERALAELRTARRGGRS